MAADESARRCHVNRGNVGGCTGADDTGDVLLPFQVQCDQHTTEAQGNRCIHSVTATQAVPGCGLWLPGVPGCGPTESILNMACLLAISYTRTATLSMPVGTTGASRISGGLWNRLQGGPSGIPTLAE